MQWVQELFNEAEYADVYDRYGLLSERTVLAHGVWLTPEELDLLARRGARISHCPNSNLFLGSGLFPLYRVLDAGVVVGLGSDIGAGTTPSLFNAMADAYKVQQVQSVSLSPFHLWYLATLGGARALTLDAETGSLEAGKSADFLVLDLNATPLLAMRTGRASSPEDLLAGLIFMGDDRAVERSFIAGRCVSERRSSPHSNNGTAFALCSCSGGPNETNPSNFSPLRAPRAHGCCPLLRNPVLRPGQSSTSMKAAAVCRSSTTTVRE